MSEETKSPEDTGEGASQRRGIDWVRLGLLAVIVLLMGVCLKVYQAKRVVISEPAGEIERPEFKITNAHDHLYMDRHLPKYLAAAENLGVVRTLFVASSKYTFLGVGHEEAVDELNDWSTNVILECAEKYPGKIIPFATLHPDDENKVEMLIAYKERGVVGVKLYTGHGSFHDRPLDSPEMLEVYEWCQETGFPLCWHINLQRYPEEFTRLMLKYPRLKVIVPHIGQAYYNPTGREMQIIRQLMERYPNLVVDLSWGTRQILVAGLERVSRYPDAFRDFILDYPDRVLWGTDMVVTGNSEKTQEWIESVLRACRDMLEKESYTFWMAADGSGHEDPSTKNPEGRLRGLNLPNEVLHKIYERNLDRFLALEP